MCKPQRRSSYNISTPISKLQLILLVVGVINVPSTQRDNISPRALYSLSAGENLTRILQGPILTAVSLHVQYNCSHTQTQTQTHTHAHSSVIEEVTDVISLSRKAQVSLTLVLENRCDIKSARKYTGPRCFYNCHLLLDPRNPHTHTMPEIPNHNGGAFQLYWQDPQRPSASDLDIDLPSTARQSVTYTYKHHLYVIRLCCD